MEDVNKLTDWVIRKIEKEYKDDIALLIGIRGHNIGGDYHGLSFDYFVPATERGNELAETFIINGVGYDLYPRSWERLEESVELNDMAILIDQAEILYARSTEDEERFLNLKKALHENLHNPEFIYKKALEYMDQALEIYKSLIFEEKSYRINCEAGYLHLYLSKAIAVLNNTYTESPIFSEKQAADDNPDTRMYHCPKMKDTPVGFYKYSKQLLDADKYEELNDAAFHLLKATRNFILDKEPLNQLAEVSDVDYTGFADWYQEMSLVWRRVKYFCENNMSEEAYIDACYLQEELLYIAQEYHMKEMNLVSFYNSDDLTLLKTRAEQIEQIIIDTLAQKQVPIASYSSLDEFLKDRI